MFFHIKDIRIIESIYRIYTAEAIHFGACKTLLQLKQWLFDLRNLVQQYCHFKFIEKKEHLNEFRNRVAEIVQIKATK